MRYVNICKVIIDEKKNQSLSHAMVVARVNIICITDNIFSSKIFENKFCPYFPYIDTDSCGIANYFQISGFWFPISLRKCLK